MWTRRAAVGVAVAAGAWTRWPLFAAPRVMDDHLHRAILEGAAPLARPPWALFDIVRRGEAPALRDAGLLPWWTDDGFAVVMFRPLTSLTLWLDHALGLSVFVSHLHSLGWWLATLLAAGWALRRLLPAAVAEGAVAVCALAAGWTLPLGWLANRGSLVAGAFGWAALGLVVRGRLGAATAAMVLAGLGGEYALGPGLVAAAWALRGPGLATDRARGLVPTAGLGVVLLLGRAWGAGASGGASYLDPLGAPLAFLHALPQRLGLLAAEGLLAMSALDLEGSPVPAVAFAGAVAVGAVAVAVRSARRLLDDASRRGLDALCLGGVAATVAVSAAPVHGRLLGPVLPALSAAVAVVLWAAARGSSTGWLRSVAGVLALVHFLAGPGRARVESSALRAVADRSTRGLTASGRGLLGVSRVVLLGAPNPEVLHYTPMVWRESLGLRVAWTALAATPAPVRVSRVEDGVRVEAGGASLVAPWAWTMYRTTPLTVGAVQRVAGMIVVVEEAPRGVPTRVRVREVPGDARWMQADRAGFNLTVLPTP